MVITFKDITLGTDDGELPIGMRHLILDNQIAIVVNSIRFVVDISLTRGNGLAAAIGEHKIAFGVKPFLE